MNKLFKLKEWLTLEETSRRLTTSLQESVSVADCLQLALDGHIKISALIEKTKYGVLCKEDGANNDLLSGFIDSMKNNEKFTNEFIKVAETSASAYSNLAGIEFRRYGGIFRIGAGIYDLPMIGAERLDVLHLCSMLQNREPATFFCLEGAFLNHNDGFINIVEPFDIDHIEWKVDFGVKSGLFDNKHKIFIDENNYHISFYPADGLRDVEFVFRRKNIEAFENSLVDDDEGKKAITLEGCLEVIGSMLDTLKSTSSKGKRWTQETLKSEMTDKRHSLSNRTIDDYFSQANKAYKSSN
ncbi:hypothetical protein D9P64_13510 [Salmonella enterica subsp. enterica serovar Kibi]|nr:hypothetical protein [Salmonella enterica subsp. enterica serovar Coquilhatville]EBY6590471.1 hypothetical protein [Salmonella enterica subsp. enterica serovar Agbeni]EBZ2861324.1 hypothetical protein [Salmonella enterica subsp. enterica serovar Kibi]HCM2493296.1 hypothetical protein [Salmonella enterica subsp. enterica serovar Lehrte]ECD7293572.1 hypothetical protein [Salmonella enterica subsp. enterica serovar Agbeni]